MKATREAVDEALRLLGYKSERCCLQTAGLPANRRSKEPPHGARTRARRPERHEPGFGIK